MAAEPVQDFSHEFVVEEPQAAQQAPERETDPHRIQQRQKQIDFGKNTLGYQRYCEQVPRASRRRQHPRTPDVHQACSKRSFDGQVRKWRRGLHQWDPQGGAEPSWAQGSSDPPAPEAEAEEGYEVITLEEVAEAAQATPTAEPLRPANGNSKAPGDPAGGNLRSPARKRGLAAAGGDAKRRASFPAKEVAPSHPATVALDDGTDPVSYSGDEDEWHHLEPPGGAAAEELPTNWEDEIQL